MAAPLDGLDLSSTPKKPSGAATSGPLAGIDLSVPATTTTQTAAPELPWFSSSPSGNDKIGEFLAKAGDTATFGLAAKLQDALGIGQKDGQTVAQQVAAAGKDIGPYGSAAADLLGYAAGPGELAVGQGIGKLALRGLGQFGENAAARVGSRMVGSAAENMGATALGNYGHDEKTTVGDLLLSGGIGLATGMLPGGRGARPDTPETSVLKANTQNAFTPLESTWINSRNVGNEFNKVTSSLPTRIDLGDALNGKIDAISKEINDSGGVISADVLGKYQRELFGAARNDAQKRVAGQFSDAIDTALGPHASSVDAANALARKAKTGGEIDKWLTDVGSAPAAIAKRLEKKPAFYQGDVGDALREIASKAPAAGPSFAQEAGMAAAKHLLGGVTGAGIGYATGQGVPGDIAGFVLGTMAPMAVNRMARLPTRNALLAARHLNATGMKVDPGVYTNPLLQGFGIMSRQAGYGAGSAGAL